MPLRRPAPTDSAATASVSQPVRALSAAVGVLALLALLVAGQARAGETGPVYLSFDKGFVPPWTALQVHHPTRAQLMGDPWGSKGQVARFEVALGDSAGGGNRSEVYYKPGGVGREAIGETSYYAFSTFFPADFQEPLTWGVFTQMHAEDSAGTFPVVALETRAAGHTRLVVRGGNPKKLVLKQFDFMNIRTDVADPVWHDFILRWTRSTGTTGVVQLWHRTGDLSFTCRASYVGPNFYADQKGRTLPAYIKQGMYRDGAKDGTHPSVVYQTGMWKMPTREGAASFFGAPSITEC